MIIALILVLLLALAYGALQGLLGHGPFRFLNTMYLKSLPGNAEIYRPENVAPVENSPLSGMNLCFLGSSVTLGATSLETSFAEYIAVRNNCTYVKEAVSGTTLADNDKTSYIQRMLHNIDPNAQFDAFICQLSTNDASSAIPLGEISSSRNLEDFDTKTVLGALEYIIVYADTTWHCPVVFYTGTQYDSPAYGKMVEQLLKLQEKYEIGVIDLWNDAEMNQVSEEDYKLYMFDGIHPTQAGYLNWWTPKMEAYLYDYLGPIKGRVFLLDTTGGTRNGCLLLHFETIKTVVLARIAPRPPFAMAYTGGCAQSHASYGVNKGSNCLFIRFQKRNLPKQNVRHCPSPPPTTCNPSDCPAPFPHNPQTRSGRFLPHPNPRLLHGRSRL